MSIIGKNRKQAREQMGISRYELSKKTGIDDSTLSKLENGQSTNPHLG